MLERTNRISFVSSKMEPEPEPDLQNGSGSIQNVPAPTSSGFATLNTAVGYLNKEFVSCFPIFPRSFAVSYHKNVYKMYKTKVNY